MSHESDHEKDASFAVSCQDDLPLAAVGHGKDSKDGHDLDTASRA